MNRGQFGSSNKSLIGAPSKYSSRHMFNKLGDFKEVNLHHFFFSQRFKK